MTIDRRPSRFCAPFVLLLALALSAAAEETFLDLPSGERSVDQLWEEYFGWRKAGDDERALDTALVLRERSLALHGEDSVEYGMALAEVGVSRLLNEEHDLAHADLEAAEALLRDQLPIYSEKLITALTFLGAALQSRGEYDAALEAFTRAQHITHRLEGANNAIQIPITYAKADTLQALGELHEADEQYRLAWKLNRVNFGSTSPEAIAAAARYGTWLRAIGEYDGAISLFHDALQEVQPEGPDRPIALPLLRGMAHAYRGGYRGKFARGMYERIIVLMTSQPEAFTVDQRIEAHLVFGDWLMQRYFERDAVEQYLAAWRIADAAGPEGDGWIAQFTEPQLVRYGEMAPRDHGGAGEFVTFEFRVTDDGRIRRVDVVDTGASARDSSRARQQFPKLSRYRPAIVDGEPVAVASMTATMYLLPPGVALEPEPVAAPARLTSRNAVAVANWTMLRGDEAMTLDVSDDD